MQTAQFLVGFLQVYALVGVVVAILFLFLGLDRVEPGARGAYAFRPLIIPGLILLWPLVVYRWRKIVRGQGADSSLQRHFVVRHRRTWKVLAAILPGILLVALALRQNGPLERPPVPLDERAMSFEVAK